MRPLHASDQDDQIRRYLATEDAHVVGIGREVEGVRKDGSTFPLDLAVSEVRVAGRRLFTGIVRDITERRRSEEERIRLIERERAALAGWRREATEKSLILEHMLEAVVVTDQEGRYALVNAAAGRLLGMDPKDLIGMALGEQPWQTFHESGEQIKLKERPIVRALKGEHVSMVQRLHTVDGREVIVNAASAPVRDEQGTIIGAVHVVHDLTEDYARARQAAQGARLRSLGELASGVAHDLNQYLGLVAGHGDLALAAIDRTPGEIGAIRDSVTMMVRAAVDGAEVVRRLLLFARPSVDGPPTRIDLTDLLRDVAKLTAPRWRDAAQQDGRHIVTQLNSEGDTSIDGWAGPLREAFANLVLNAVDALPRGGTIRLVARNQSDSVVVEVVDDGEGMTEQTRERLFEPFFSTKGENGSGLGLSIVSGIAERHGGRVEVETAAGQGSTFRLVFPASRDAETAITSRPVQQSVRPLRILVVDDEPALASMLARLLETDSHSVVVAPTAEEALIRLEEQDSEVIVSDLGLGPGMNGWELAAAIAERDPRPYFILATGWGAEIDPGVARERGVDTVVSKPYRLADFRRAMSAI